MKNSFDKAKRGSPRGEAPSKQTLAPNDGPRTRGIFTQAKQE